jgi:hypothetical protein
MGKAWRTVVTAAPALVQKCKDVWTGVAERRPRAVARRLAEANAQIDVRVQTLEEDSAASFDVVHAMAEQHSQIAEQSAGLVEEVDALSTRVRLLSWACAGLVVAVAVLFGVVLK